KEPARSLLPGSRLRTRARLRRRQLRVQYDRHRSVVDELDRHARAEDAALHRNATAGKRSAELQVKGFCLFRRRGLRKARPVSLARVCQQRELAHNERRPAAIEQASVESPLGILEDPEPCSLAGELYSG